MILTITMHEPDRVELRLQPDGETPGTIALLPPDRPTEAPRRRFLRLAGGALRWTGAVTVLGAGAGIALVMMPAGHPGVGAGAAALKSDVSASAEPSASSGGMPPAMRAALAAPPQVTPPPGAPGASAPPSDDPFRAFGLER